jgi:hypothetical protein
MLKEMNSAHKIKARGEGNSWQRIEQYLGSNPTGPEAPRP